MDKKQEEKLIFFAKKNLGKPYEYGAKPLLAPQVFDCSSFVLYLYKGIGIDLPRTTIEQAHLGKKMNRREKNLKIGDLLFFTGTAPHYNEEFPMGIGHVAMYLGNDECVEAKYEQREDCSDAGSVRITKVGELLNRKDLVVIKRIV